MCAEMWWVPSPYAVVSGPSTVQGYVFRAFILANIRWIFISSYIKFFSSELLTRSRIRRIEFIGPFHDSILWWRVLYTTKVTEEWEKRQQKRPLTSQEENKLPLDYQRLSLEDPVCLKKKKKKNTHILSMLVHLILCNPMLMNSGDNNFIFNWDSQQDYTVDLNKLENSPQVAVKSCVVNKSNESSVLSTS